MEAAGTSWKLSELARQRRRPASAGSAARRAGAPCGSRRRLESASAAEAKALLSALAAAAQELDGPGRDGAPGAALEQEEQGRRPEECRPAACGRSWTRPGRSGTPCRNVISGYQHALARPGSSKAEEAEERPRQAPDGRERPGLPHPYADGDGEGATRATPRRSSW